MERYFTSVPKQENVLDLRENYNVNLLKKILTKIKYVEDKINVDLKRLKLDLLSLDATEKLCPGLSVFESELSNALLEKNLDKMIDILNEITIYLKNYSIISGLEVECILAQQWERYVVSVLRNQDTGDINKKIIVRPPVGVQLEHQRKNVSYIINKIQELDQDLWFELDSYVSYVKLFTGQVIVGATSKQSFGSIVLRLPEETLNENEVYMYYLEHLTHEVSHLHLHAMMEIDPIVLNNPKDRFDAPIRTDPRPMYGIFHATFVLSRVVRMLRKFHDASIFDTTYLYNDMLKRFKKGFLTIRKDGVLTNAGKMVLNSMEETAGVEV